MKALAVIALLLAAEPAEFEPKTWLGLMVVPTKLAATRCALVVAVAPSGPAAGRIARGECISAVDGIEVTDAESFTAVTRKKVNGDLVVVQVADRSVLLKVVARPDDGFLILCKQRKLGTPHVRVAFDGRKIEIEMPDGATVAEARKAIGAPKVARAMINPRIQCDQTATPVVVDAPEDFLLENNDSVVFMRDTRP